MSREVKIYAWTFVRDALSALAKKCHEKSTKIGANIYVLPVLNRLGNYSSHQKCFEIFSKSFYS